MRDTEPKFWDVECVYRSGVALALTALVSPAAWAGQQAPRPQMPTLPLTQLDESLLAADLDNRIFTLTFAQPLPIHDLLLLIVRGTNLSIVPDPGIEGSFIGELKNVTVRQALELILPPLGLGYRVEGPFIRVVRLEPQTRLYDINYIASIRTGDSRIGPAASDDGASYAAVTTATSTDVFADIERGVQTLLSDGAGFNVDRKAGLLQVTDYPERLDRVGFYLDAVMDRAFRQVQIDARIVEIELNDPTATALDWTLLSVQAATMGATRSTDRPAQTGLRVTDVGRFLAALAAQGTVTVLANPQLYAVNNEPAIVRAVGPAAGAQGPGLSGNPLESLTLSVTPQIAPGGVVMLSVSPLLGLRTGAAGASQARESDTLARLGNGESIVLTAAGYDREVTERKVTGVTGGWFGRSTVTTRKHVELLILLTPKLLAPASSQ